MRVTKEAIVRAIQNGKAPVATTKRLNGLSKQGKPPLKLKKLKASRAEKGANGGNGHATSGTVARASVSKAPETGAKFALEPKLLHQIYDNMVKARVLEERLIRMYKQSDGYFWIGGPGEEAFNVPLGLSVHKGKGLDYDYLHLHYRSSAILLAMGVDPLDPLRQMKNTATDPFSGGRNFCGHVLEREWNVVPVTSPIEVQYSTAIGTGTRQQAPRRQGHHDRQRRRRRHGRGRLRLVPGLGLAPG